MGKCYPCSIKCEKIIVIILHINGGKAFLPIFYDDKENLTPSYEIQIRIYQLIFNHNKISKDLWYNDIHSLIKGRKIMWQFFIFTALDTLSYYFITTKTPYLPSVKYKRTFLNKYTAIKIHQKINFTSINKIYKRGGKYCGNYLYIFSQSHFPIILW